MEELDLVMEKDSDLNKELAPYPLPLTYCETAFLLNMHDVGDRVTKYGNFCWHVKDIFLNFDTVYDFVCRIPYTYNKNLNNAAYLYRSHWQLPGDYTSHVASFVTEVTDLPNDLVAHHEKRNQEFHFTSSFFTKAWYDMHYIEMQPHQDDEAGGMFDLNQPIPQDRSIPFVMLVYMNDGFGTSLYNTTEKDRRRNSKVELEKMLGRFNFINLETRNDWQDSYTEIMTSPGQKNSAFIYPANTPHRVSKYKASTPVEEFEKNGRFYLMNSFSLNFI